MEAELYCTAWELHELGYSVIPSGGGDSGKHPLIPWTEYQSRQPTDEEMHTWQDEHRPTLWGVVTGAIVVFDWDRERGGGPVSGGWPQAPRENTKRRRSLLLPLSGATRQTRAG